MSPVSNFVVPEEDEFAYSWLARLAYINASDMIGFCDSVTGFLPKSFDVSRLLPKLHSRLNGDIVMSLLELYDKLTLIRCGVLECSDISKSRYVMQLQNYKHVDVVKHLHSINVCPECIAEDDCNYRYIRRKHQLPGVVVCYKHGCKLMSYKKAVFNSYCVPEYEDIVNLDNYVPVQSDVPDELAYKYAVFMASFFDEDLGCSCSFDTLHTVLYHKAGEKGYDSALLEKRFDSSEYACLAESDGNYLSRERSSVINTVAIALFLYDDFEGFIRDIRKAVSDDKIVEKLCDICGNTYITTGWLESNGIHCSCIYDASSADEFYRPLIKAVGRHKYYPFAIESGFRPARIKHHVCGNENYKKPVDFVFNGSRCRCEYTEMNIGCKMDKVFGFEVTSYPKRRERSIFIRHLGCGRIFEIENLDEFVQKPVCEWCGRHSDQDFKEYIHNISNGEYSAVEKYCGKNASMILKHNVCGKTSRSAYSTFVDNPNPECKYCKLIDESKREGSVANLIYGVGYGNLIRLEALIDSMGENFKESRKKVYQCINFMARMGIVYRIFDGVYAFSGYKLNEFKVVDSVTLYVYLMHRFSKTDIIRFRDVHIEYLDANMLENYKRILSDSGKLRRIFDDMYVFAENTKEYTSKEILEAYYININGKQIGRYAVADRAETGRLYIKTTVLAVGNKYNPCSIAKKLGIVASIRGCTFDELDKADARVIRETEAARIKSIAEQKRKDVECQKLEIMNAERRRRFDDVDAEVRELSNDEFELVSWVSSEKNMVVRHKCCGHNVLALLGNFRKTQYCEHCSGKMNDSRFREEVKKLVGDEYVVVGNYQGYHAGIELLHKSCGNVFVGDPANFLSGNRCPICKKIITRKYLVDLVKRYTSGHYLIDETGSTSSVVVTDIETGRNFTLSAAFIKQELLRPTRSDVLLLTDEEEKARQHLLSESNVKTVSGSKLDDFLDYLRANYRADDLIFTDEFAKEGQGGYTRVESKKFIRGLVKKKVLRSVAKSVYAFAKNTKEYTDEELFENKYVNRNGVKIGEWVEYVLPDGKKEKRIISSKVADVRWRDYMFNGTSIKIMRMGGDDL